MGSERVMPVCPDCGEEMTKEKHQHEEGFWEYFWHCGCKVEEGKNG